MKRVLVFRTLGGLQESQSDNGLRERQSIGCLVGENVCTKV